MCYAISPTCKNADDIQEESFKTEKRFGGGKDRQLKTSVVTVTQTTVSALKKKNNLTAGRDLQFYA